MYLLSGSGTSDHPSVYTPVCPAGPSGGFPYESAGGSFLREKLDAVAKYTEYKSSDLCDGCISLSIAEGLVSGVSAFFFLPVSGPYFIPVFLTFKVFFFLFTLPCSQTCEQTFVNKAQNIFKVNFYSKGNPSFSSTFMNPSGSFFGRIRFHER